MRVVALVPYRTVATGSAVDGSCAANGQAVQTARELPGGIGLDDDVEMIGLDGEMQDAEGAVAANGENAAQIGEDVVRAERGKFASRAESDVDRIAGVVLGPTNMRRAGPGT